MNIFTYGSLMFAPVWQRVVRGACRREEAMLAGHARFAISGETYPGMVRQPGASVSGMLYREVGAEDVAALDVFEGSAYRRVPVLVRLASGAELAAETYLYLLPQNLSKSPWLPEEFRLQRFLETYCRQSGE